jgi:hypothetical protein
MVLDKMLLTTIILDQKYSPPSTKNGLNVTTIKGAAMTEMDSDETFGTKATTSSSVVWEKGIVREINSLLVSCHPAPEISKNSVRHPSGNDYCPVCISLV